MITILEQLIFYSLPDPNGNVIQKKQMKQNKLLSETSMSFIYCEGIIFSKKNILFIYTRVLYINHSYGKMSKQYTKCKKRIRTKNISI